MTAPSEAMVDRVALRFRELWRSGGATWLEVIDLGDVRVRARLLVTPGCAPRRMLELVEQTPGAFVQHAEAVATFRALCDDLPVHRFGFGLAGERRHPADGRRMMRLVERYAAHEDSRALAAEVASWKAQAPVAACAAPPAAVQASLFEGGA